MLGSLVGVGSIVRLGPLKQIPRVAYPRGMHLSAGVVIALVVLIVVLLLAVLGRLELLLALMLGALALARVLP